MVLKNSISPCFHHVKGKERTARKEDKRTDLPFNFYIVDFGEKNARLARDFNSLAPFS